MHDKFEIPCRFSPFFKFRVTVIIAVSNVLSLAPDKCFKTFRYRNDFKHNSKLSGTCE